MQDIINIMRRLNLLISLSLSFSFFALSIAEAAPEEPPIAVVIKTPAGKQNRKVKKPRKKVTPIEKVECPEPVKCPDCAASAPTPVVECPAPVVCPQPEVCALTLEEAAAKKGNLNLSFALAFNKEKSSGLNKFNKESWLVSPWSLGFIVGAEYYFTERLSIFTNYSLAKTQFANAQTGIILVQNNDSTSAWDIGTKYNFAKYFDVRGHIGLRQDYSLYIDSLPYAYADDFWHGLFGFACGYHIWQNNRISFDGATGFDIYFPSTKSAYKLGTGDAINTEIKVSFKYKPDFFALFKYEYFQLKPSSFTQQSGNYFLFGFGINLRSKVLKSDFWSQN